MSSSPLKVIIVGGSVTGLTLAHSLDKIGVDYTILEKRSYIAPQEGASIGILPNGARILDQLGVYSQIEQTTAPLGISNIYFPDGFHFPSHYPKRLHELFGYPILFMERKKLLQILYDALPDKTKVRTGITVSKIDQSGQGKGQVRACTVSGEVFEADLVVGADGVHSSVRSQIWKAARPGASRMLENEDTTMTADYSCIFGISTGHPHLHAGEQFMRINDGWTLVVIPSKDDVVFWFLVEKLDRRYHYTDSPRYTTEDAAARCLQLADVPVYGNVCFGDVWERRSVVNMTVLHESVVKMWSCGRRVCIGDSIHKMTINLGQGANCAIEDVAVLTNMLNDCLKSKIGEKPSGQELEALLHRFNKIHLPRVSLICSMSWLMTRVHARDGLIRKLAGRYGLPYLGAVFEGRPFRMIANAEKLDFLPVPRTSSPGWTMYKTKKTKSRGGRWIVLFSASLLLALLWYRK